MMNKKCYMAPNVSIVELNEPAQIMAGSYGEVVPSGPGTSVDQGTGAARPYPGYGRFNIWDEVEE